MNVVCYNLVKLIIIRKRSISYPTSLAVITIFNLIMSSERQACAKKKVKTKIRLISASSDRVYNSANNFRPVNQQVVKMTSSNLG